MPFVCAAVLITTLAFFTGVPVTTGYAASQLFTSAYGTFSPAQNAIDGDKATSAESTGEPYRGEYFLIARYPQPFLLRNLKVRFSGKEPASYIVEMTNDPNFLNWTSLQIGEKAIGVRVRFPAAKGDVYKIAEIESNSEIVASEPFYPVRIAVDRIDTHSATLHIQANKPFAMSVNWGYENNPSSLNSYSEYTSYMTTYDVTINDLMEGIDHYMRIKMTTAAGELFVTGDTELVHFRTLGLPPLRLISVAAGDVKPLSIQIVVHTNIPSHCVFYFGEQSYFTNVESKPTFDTRHVFEFKDLVPNHIYSYMAHMTDFRGMSVSNPKAYISTAEMNIARGKRVIAGTFTQLREPGFQGGGVNIGDTVLQRVTDNQLGYFTGMAHSGGVSGADQFAVIDLGRVYTLESHATVWRQLAYPYYYEMQTSLDNKKWTTTCVLPPERMGQVQRTRSGSGDPLVVAGGPFNDSPERARAEGRPLERVKARYVKLVVPKGSKFYKKHKAWDNLDLAEIKIYPGGEYEDIRKIVAEEWQP